MSRTHVPLSSLNRGRLQLVVFALVAAATANIYITQPVLPVLQDEFAASALVVSYTVAAVILGIAVANMPFGALVDRLTIRPIILAGTLVVAAAALVCAVTGSLWLLIGARFVQGLFIPALTTCLVAFLSRTLPPERLGVVMGSYVSATVVGGLGGRLLGGWIHPPLDWRYAFVSAAALILAAGLLALLALPRETAAPAAPKRRLSYLKLVGQWPLLRIFLVSFSGFFVFSSIFNYLPFRLEAPPFNLDTEWITLLYLTYLVGIFMGPAAGRLSDRFGGGATMVGGTLALALAAMLTLTASVTAVVIALLCACAGFFALHTAAVGTLNRRIDGGQGRANALYVLFYYLGGWCGITVCGVVFEAAGWRGAVILFVAVLILPLMIGMAELRARKAQDGGKTG